MNKNMYMDLHVLQTLPPSCVNRDDTGSPKTAYYGGVMRARVSSQAWKRAMRMDFKEIFSADQIGYRTKNTVKLVAEEIKRNNNEIQPEKAEEMAKNILELAGVKPEEGKKDVLFFISTKQVEAIARLAEEYASSTKKSKDEYKKKAKQVLKDNPSIDILLFGRMAASAPELNYDAAAQVAHSISTHAVSTEYDYFTAVDDFGEEDNMGAGHLGTVEFNSSTMYRYATVNLGELAKYLTEEELKLTAKGFAEAFIRSMPTGKQNTFANRTLPDLVYVTMRNDQPINLVGAFEKPISADNSGYVEKSKNELFNYAHDVYQDYVSEPVCSWIIGGKDDFPGEKVNLTGLLEGIEKAVSEYSDRTVGE